VVEKHSGDRVTRRAEARSANREPVSDGGDLVICCPEKGGSGRTRGACTKGCRVERQYKKNRAASCKKHHARSLSLRSAEAQQKMPDESSFTRQIL
jgi:hypothetical protein